MTLIFIEKISAQQRIFVAKPQSYTGVVNKIVWRKDEA